MAQSTADRGKGMKGLRRANSESILEALRRHGPSSQAALARATGLAPATVTGLVRDLREEGRVSSRPLNRRESVISLAAPTGRVATFSVSTGSLRGMLVDFAEGRRVDAVAPAPSEGDGGAVDAVDGLLSRLLDAAKAERSDLQGVAVGVQAPISKRTGRVASWASADLPSWRAVDLPARLEETLGVPVLVGNDANMAALGEWAWGAGRGSENLFYVLFSDHIGAAIMLDGALLQGADGMAGEIGHMVVDSDGPMCMCGSRGCLAVYASKDAILGSLRPHAEYADVRAVIDAARGGDLPARGVLFEIGRRLGRALADVGKLIAPDTMVLGGEFGRAGSLLLEGLRASIEVKSLRAVSPEIQFRAAEIVADEVLLGGVAALLRRDGGGLDELPAWLRGTPR